MTVAAVVDADALVRKAAELGATGLGKAIGTANARAGRAVRVAVVKHIRESWVIKTSDLNAQITIEAPRGTDVPASQQYVELRAKGGPIPLVQFGAKMGLKGVTYRISKKKARRVYKARGRAGFVIGKRPLVEKTNRRSGRTSLKKGTFVPDPRFGGHAWVSIPGSSRILKVHGPGIAQRVAGRRARRVMEQRWLEQWPKEFTAAIQQRIRVAEAKARRA